jgi:hypothetical protein
MDNDYFDFMDDNFIIPSGASEPSVHLEKDRFLKINDILGSQRKLI